MYGDIPEDLRGLVEPVVQEAGLELVDLVLTRGRSPWLLRITIDTCLGDGRVAVDRCAAVSREVGTLLDAADAVPSRYRLEVSSPGLDRTLAREKDFTAACGSEVRVETRRPLAGRRRFRGRLVAFDGEVARLRVDGDEVGIPFDAVAKANVVYEITGADFSSSGSRVNEAG
ncbi:MAG: ribosome maturation factor RimP [Myxococcota bacterium]|nr:ribosome maturation factor RimP [Myxococcota bacterium]